MKNLILVCLLFILTTTFSYGSHIAGGDITSRNIGGLTYVVTASYYYDSSYTGFATFLPQFCYIDSLGTTVLSSTPTAHLVNSSLLIDVFRRCIYIDTIAFPSVGFYTIQFTDCCRSLYITNISNGGSNFYMKNLLYADSTNSSTYFLNPGIIIAQLGDTFNFNSLAFDVDGDSLVYSLETPLSNIGNCPAIDTIVPGYTYPPSDTAVPFSINAQTGNLNFLPTMQVYAQYMILVKEYRNGIFIGSIERDLPLLVIPSINLPRLITWGSNTYPYNGNQFTIAPNDTFTLNLSAIDPDNFNINMTIQGEPMQLLLNPSTFNISTSTGIANAQFTWIPTIANEREKPYTIVVRVREDFLSRTFESDITYTLKVGDFVGLNGYQNLLSMFTISPNPTSSQSTITSPSIIDELGIMDIY